MRQAFLLIVLFVTMWPAAVPAAESAQVTKNVPAGALTQSADEKAVRESAKEFVTAFNKADAKGIGALWTVDCEYVDETGRTFRGRDAVEKEYSAFFAAHPGLTMDVSISAVKMIGDHAAIEDGNAVLKNAQGSPVSLGSYTAIHLKEGGKWLLASVRERAAASTSKRPTLEDLDWLVGDWSAVQGAKNLAFTYKWIADKKFLELTYVTRDKGNPVRSGIQILGRDPLTGDVVSWSFDSTGGYGQGHWQVLKRGAIVESRGIMADGVATGATEILSKIDNDNFTVKSVNRRVAGERLPDSEAVNMKRNPK